VTTTFRLVEKSIGLTNRLKAKNGQPAWHLTLGRRTDVFEGNMNVDGLLISKCTDTKPCILLNEIDAADIEVIVLVAAWSECRCCQLLVMRVVLQTAYILLA
jgi:hypothetical protein